MRILAISHLLNMEFITDLSQDLFMFLRTNVGTRRSRWRQILLPTPQPRQEECYLKTILQDKQALTDYTLTRNQVQKVVLQPICRQDKASGFQPFNCSIYYITVYVSFSLRAITKIQKQDSLTLRLEPGNQNHLAYLAGY